MRPFSDVEIDVDNGTFKTTSFSSSYKASLQGAVGPRQGLAAENFPGFRVQNAT